MIAAPEGQWWLDYGPEGVWPCDVKRASLFNYFVVVPSHPQAQDYNKEIQVPASRVFDSNFNRPRVVTE